MSFHIHDNRSRSEREDLEKGRLQATAKDNGFLHACYPYLSGRGLHASWKLFGCCMLMGLINVFSTSFTLAVTMALRTSDIVLESNALLLSTGCIFSLFWRLHISHHQPIGEDCQEPLSRAKLCMVGCLFTVMLSPAVACLPLLVIFYLFGDETFSYYTPGMPLILSWASINILAAFLVPSFVLGREMYQQGKPIKRDTPPQENGADYDTHKNFDETDGPTFLPQQPAFPYYHISAGLFSEDMKAAVTLIPTISWENTIEPSEALRELVRWAASAPTESLQPPVAAEMLTIAAISIGVQLDGVNDWNQDSLSRTCDRLAEIFRRADQSGVPDHAVNVFLLVNRFEQFDGVDVTVLGSDSCNIPGEELKRIVRCLESRSASSLG